ncbi:hypothetical protein [Paraclostridium sp. AKS73]|uniref:hypothetical protein n=1 Tax=Paraclostridium sp. AKS73 TaxID=2876116 RepID=UPI0021E0731E|nr:hypothetical protein [Paraclostridium sp. AKS73]MCU9816170.1 hypothetical protein [Paraclostridium sp. AKS73]
MREFIDVLRDYYDYIFIDTPPIGIIMDAGVLANYADGTILVVGAKDVETERAKISKERLEKVKANVIGAVLNKYIEKMVRMGTIAIIMNKVIQAEFLKRKRRNTKIRFAHVANDFVRCSKKFYAQNINICITNFHRENIIFY